MSKVKAIATIVILAVQTVSPGCIYAGLAAPATSAAVMAHQSEE